MANEVLQQKLDSIARCLERLRQKQPKTVDDLILNPDLQDIVIINLERLVHKSVDIANIVLAQRKVMPLPVTMAESFVKLSQNNIISPELGFRLSEAVGFRNICVHEYDKIDWNIVFAILRSRLDDYRSFAKTINTLAYTKSRNNGLLNAQLT
jgi:uncharacterized protein YutE (UPF0331/DUF86 family)